MSKLKIAHKRGYVNNKTTKKYFANVVDIILRKSTIIRSGLRLWQVADYLGMSDCTFSKKLRYDFSAEETQKVMDAITALDDQKM